MILYGSGDPIAALKKVGRYVRSVHCKDAKWAARPGEEWGAEVPLGQGDVGMETVPPHAQGDRLRRPADHRARDPAGAGAAEGRDRPRHATAQRAEGEDPPVGRVSNLSERMTNDEGMTHDETRMTKEQFVIRHSCFVIPAPSFVLRHFPFTPSAILTVVLGCLVPAAANAAAPLGLTLGAGGTVFKDGAPYRGVGVNYFNCFLRTLEHNNDTSYDAGFAVLAKHNIPFARFSAAGYWPRDMKLYTTDRAEYFRRLDGVVRSAEKHRLGLIPSLFWHHACVPDLVGEPCDQWGNRQSKTHAFMRQYVREVVMRYKDSPAIWAWEFGNEYSNAADLPNAAQHRPAVVPNRGTALKRSDRDDLSYDMLAVAWTEFAKEVRKYDRQRLITTGNSILRPQAWHNRREKSWKKDTPEQFAEMLALSTPDPMDLISVHCYGENMGRLGEAAAEAAKLGKQLFVGEFQVADSASPSARKTFDEFLGQLREHRVPLAAVWVFDLAAQEKDFNITADNCAGVAVGGCYGSGIISWRPRARTLVDSYDIKQLRRTACNPG